MVTITPLRTSASSASSAVAVKANAEKVAVNVNAETVAVRPTRRSRGDESNAEKPSPNAK